MNESMYKAIVERMVAEEALVWFQMEDSVFVKPHTPRLHHTKAGSLIYRVLVEFIPRGHDDTEAAILEIVVNEYGANVENEKRTDGGWK